MAKTKRRSTSAAQRREQVREQRQQRLNTGQNKNTHNRRRRQSNTNSWLLVGGIVVVVAAIIGIFIYIGNQPTPGSSNSGSTGSSATATPNADAVTAFNTLTNVDPHVLATVGTGNATNSIIPVKGTAVWKGQDGKPVIFYMGGEFCPYCAAQRWGMIVALSRFGSFSGPLPPISSSEDNISTFSFHNGPAYTSQYIDLEAKEVSDQQSNQLDQLTAEENQAAQKYDAPPYIAGQPGGIPFISIANQQVIGGALYSPQTLIGLSYQDINNQLKNPSSNVAKGIFGTANYLTAAICTVTNNQPANVCTVAPILQIQQSLRKASLGPASAQVGMVDGQLAMVTRRQD